MVKQDQKKAPTMKAKSCYPKSRGESFQPTGKAAPKRKRENIILISNLPVRKVTASPCGQSE